MWCMSSTSACTTFLEERIFQWQIQANNHRINGKFSNLIINTTSYVSTYSLDAAGLHSDSRMRDYDMC